MRKPWSKILPKPLGPTDPCQGSSADLRLGSGSRQLELFKLDFCKFRSKEDGMVPKRNQMRTTSKQKELGLDCMHTSSRRLEADLAKVGLRSIRSNQPSHPDQNNTPLRILGK